MGCGGKHSGIQSGFIKFMAVLSAINERALISLIEMEILKSSSFIIHFNFAAAVN